MATIKTINANDLITDSRADLNDNFSNLNSDKIETSTLDTDTTLAANSDLKIPSQKAVKSYVDSGGNVNASETSRGIVQEATDAQVTAGTATGSTGAKLFVTPTKLQTSLGSLGSLQIAAGEDLLAGSAVYITGTDLAVTQASANQGSSISDGAKEAQTFLYATAVQVKSIVAKIQNGTGGQQTTDITCHIYATSAGVPTGSSLGNKVVASGTVGAFDTKDLTFTFDTPISLTANTTYAFELTSSTSNFNARYQDTNAYANGTRVSYSGSYSIQATHDLYFTINLGVTPLLAKKASGAAAATTNTFAGFCKSAVSSGATATIIVSGIINTLTGLLLNTVYYISDTAGLIQTTAGSTTKKVGIALSSTELLIKNDN